MDKSKFLSSAMCDDEIASLQTRKNSIVDEIAEKRSQFESADVETRDAILTDIESRNSDIESIDAEIEEVKELRSQFEKQEERLGSMKQFSTEAIEERKASNDIYDTKEYRAAWKNYVLTNDPKEIRALTTATENVPIPTLMQGYIETAWEKYGKFSRLVNRMRYPGYLAVPYEASADPASVHTEGTNGPAEEQVTLGQIELKPAMIKKWISMTDELRALAPDEFIRYVAEELVYRVVLKLDEGIINGALDDDGKGVVGIVGNSRTASITANLGFNVVNEAIAELKTFDNLVVAMNQKTFFKYFMGLTDLQGRPIYQIATDNTGRPRFFINGIRVEFTNALPSIDVIAANTSTTYMVVGNFDGYRLNLPEGDGVKTLVDPYTLAVDDKVRLIGRLYAAGDITKLGHFVEVKTVASESEG